MPDSTARVRISSPALSLICGPWRVLERTGTDPAVLPPDVRQAGRWVDTVELPKPITQMVEEAILAEFRGWEAGR